MYNRTKADLTKVFEIIDDIPKGEKKRNWFKLTEKLNLYFETQLTKHEWKAQYDTAKVRLRKYGSYELRGHFCTKKEVTESEPKSEIDYTKLKLKLRKYIARPKTMEQIKKYLNIDEYTIMGCIHSLKLENYLVSYNTSTQCYAMEHNIAVKRETYDHSIGKLTEFEFVVCSDSHLCQTKQQLSFINFIYDEAERRKITKVYHAGDITDGFYKNRPEQIYDLFKIGADEQKDYVVKNWPKRDGIKTYLIIGNHDETHIKNGGFNIGKAIANERDDFEYLGIGHARILLTPNCIMDLLHPLDGSSYAVSYSGQKYMDALTGGDKPNILFVGHHHKCLYFPYRNIHYFEVPSMTGQSAWMKRKRIANSSGAWFIKLTVDEEGTIVSIKPEHIMQYKYLENDY